MHRHSSIMQEEKRCYITHRTTNLEVHHCLNGTHQRKKADVDGLWVYLTADVHRYIHQTIEGHELLMQLKREAQQAYERTHTRAEFIKRYGKSYL